MLRFKLRYNVSVVNVHCIIQMVRMSIYLLGCLDNILLIIFCFDSNDYIFSIYIMNKS